VKGDFLLKVQIPKIGVTTALRKRWLLCYCRDSYISISGCNVCSSNFQYQLDALLGSFNIKGLRERALKRQLEKSYDKIRCISIYCINCSENTMDWWVVRAQGSGPITSTTRLYLSSCIIFDCLYVLHSSGLSKTFFWEHTREFMAVWFGIHSFKSSFKFTSKVSIFWCIFYLEKKDI
jgi:hypothetical protein